MQGLMQSWPLTIDRIVDHAATWRPQAEIYTAASEGAPSRTTYGQVGYRAQRLAAALSALGVRRGDVVGVIGANTARQLEAWYAITGMGAVCHPLNPDLTEDRIAAHLTLAGDKVVFVDPELLPAIEPALRRCPAIEQVIVLCEPERIPATSLARVAAHDTVILQSAGTEAWGGMDETSPAVLTHTAGGGEAAKGVVWTHRSCVLQALIASGPDGLDLTSREVVLPLVPFWRAAGWGVVFSGPLAGAKLVLAGVGCDPEALRFMIDREAVSLAVASSAELQGLHDQFRAENRKPSHLKRVIAAGGPCPTTLARAWKQSFGVEALSAWGLTETSALGGMANAAVGEMHPPFGLELEVTDRDGQAVPRDGVTIGRVKARGGVVSSRYFGEAEAAASDGFVDTGDLASIDENAQIRMVGRADEMVSAGDKRVPVRRIEDAALEHPATAEAAVIDAPSSRGLGPVLVVRRRAGETASKEDYLSFVGDRVGPALAPAEVLFVDGLPLDALGRVDRRVLKAKLEALSATAVAPEPAPVEAPAAIPDLVAAGEVIYEPPLPEAEPEAQQLTETDEPQPLIEIQPDPVTAQTVYDLAAAPTPTPTPEAQPEEHEPLDEPDVAPILASGIGPGLDLWDDPLLDPTARMSQETDDSPPPEAAVAAVAAESAEPAIQEPEFEATPFARIEPRDPNPRATPIRRPKRAPPPGPARVFLSVTTAFAVLPLLIALDGVLAARLGLADWRSGLDDLLLVWPFKIALVGMVGGVLALFVGLMVGIGKVWKRVLTSLLLPLAILAALFGVRSLSETYPPLHDVATDWSSPITLSPALMQARGPSADPVEEDPIIPSTAGAYMNRRVAEVNLETCPAARPVLLAEPTDQAYERARAAIKAEGLELFSEDPEGGRFEAVATGLWLGFKDDVVVRVRPDPKGARIDLRSVSRQGQNDLGANCRRVAELTQAIRGGAAN